MGLPSWPHAARWSRQRRSAVAMAAAAAAMVALLWLLHIPLSYAPEPIGGHARFFAEGARVTVELTLIAGVGGVLLGILAALAKTSPFAALRWLAAGYIWVIRGTPLLVQVLFVFFALPVLVPALQMSDFASAAVALAINVGAYNAEAIRAGLQAVPRGQLEAARSLGMNRWFMYIDVVFPQAFKVALPPLVNNMVALLKDSSLAYAIGVVELTNVGNRLQASTFQPLSTLLTTATIYLLLTTVMTRFSNALERRYDVEGRLA